MLWFTENWKQSRRLNIRLESFVVFRVLFRMVSVSIDAESRIHCQRENWTKQTKKLLNIVFSLFSFFFSLQNFPFWVNFNGTFLYDALTSGCYSQHHLLMHSVCIRSMKTHLGLFNYVFFCFFNYRIRVFCYGSRHANILSLLITATLTDRRVWMRITKKYKFILSNDMYRKIL